MPFDPSSLPKNKRFRANLSDLFLSGDVAGQRAHSLFADAKAAGTQHVTDLAGNDKPDGNSARDLLRRLRKRSHWPPLYWADVPVWLDKKIGVVHCPQTGYKVSPRNRGETLEAWGLLGKN